MRVRQHTSAAPTAQPRERAVICAGCLHRATWSLDGVCDTCKGSR